MAAPIYSDLANPNTLLHTDSDWMEHPQSDKKEEFAKNKAFMKSPQIT